MEKVLLAYLSEQDLDGYLKKVKLKSYTGLSFSVPTIRMDREKLPQLTDFFSTSVIRLAS